MMNYCNGVRSFINYELFNIKILVKTILNVHVRVVRIKITPSKYCFEASSTKKRFIKKYLCLFAHGETYVPYETIIEMIVGLTFSSSIVHELVEAIIIVIVV